MKTSVILSGIAVLAMAGSAMGQAAAAASQLRLRLVPVDVSSTAPSATLSFQNDSVHNTVAATDPAGVARTRRFTVQYQVGEGAGFEGLIASLAAMQFSITGSTSGGSSPIALSFSRAVLTAGQARTTGSPNAVTPVGATDVTGASAGAGINRQGLHQSFRGGLSPNTQAGNTLPSNGTISPPGIALITPLTLSQLDQAPASFPGEWFGLYDFNVQVADNNGPGDASVNLSVFPIADAQTQNAYGVYEDGDVIPRTGRNFVGGSASFLVEAIPAPGSLALIGLGGLVAARRRRA